VSEPTELFELLGTFRTVVRHRVQAELDVPALPYAQVELLRLVHDQPGIAVAEAARRLRLAGNTVSTLVGQLSRLGYLDRRPDPADKRIARLALAPAGEKRLADWRSRRAELLAAAHSRLPAADRDSLSAAVPALRRLLEELER
jgi:DNA-binding MarR family transcriptional regulator